MKRVQRLLPFLLNLHVPSPPSREASGGGRGRFACGSNGFSQERSLLFRAHEKRLGRERPWGARPSISRCAGNQAVGLADFGVFVLRTWGLRALPSKALTRFTDPVYMAFPTCQQVSACLLSFYAVGTGARRTRTFAAPAELGRRWDPFGQRSEARHASGLLPVDKSVYNSVYWLVWPGRRFP